MKMDIDKLLAISKNNLLDIHQYPSPVEGMILISACCRRADRDSESGDIDYAVES